MQQRLPMCGTCARRPHGGRQQNHPCDEGQSCCAGLLHGCRKCGQSHRLAAVQDDQPLGQRPQAQLLMQPAVQAGAKG